MTLIPSREHAARALHRWVPPAGHDRADSRRVSVAAAGRSPQSGGSTSSTGSKAAARPPGRDGRPLGMMRCGRSGAAPARRHAILGTSRRSTWSHGLNGWADPEPAWWLICRLTRRPVNAGWARSSTPGSGPGRSAGLWASMADLRQGSRASPLGGPRDRGRESCRPTRRRVLRTRRSPPALSHHSRRTSHEPASQPRPTAASDRPDRHRHHDRHLGPRRVRLDGQQDQLDRRHRQRLLRGQDRRHRQVRWAVRRQPDGDRPGRRHRRDRRGGCGRSGRQHPPRSRVERRDRACPT